MAIDTTEIFDDLIREWAALGARSEERIYKEMNGLRQEVNNLRKDINALQATKTLLEVSVAGLRKEVDVIWNEIGYIGAAVKEQSHPGLEALRAGEALREAAAERRANEPN